VYIVYKSYDNRKLADSTRLYQNSLSTMNKQHVNVISDVICLNKYNTKSVASKLVIHVDY